MAEAKVTITADDRASAALQQISAETKNVGTSSVDASKKVQTVNGALRAAKKEAMELTAQWRALDDSMKNSDYGSNLKSQLDQVLQKAGELQDIKGDVANEINNLASDTAIWDGAKQGIGVLSSSMQGLASVVGMCGGDVESFTKALNIMKGIEAATNTVIGIGNALQKNSALMVALRTLKTKLFGNAQKVANAAIVQNTVATGAQTGAIEAQTAAQEANNAAVLANPYVAVAAAIVGITVAIVAWVNATDDATEANEGLAEATDDVISATEDGWKEYVKTKFELDDLKTKLDNFNGSKEEEEKLCKELNSSYGDLLGTYQSIAEWKETLTDMTDIYCTYLMHEAKLQGLIRAYGDAYAKMKLGEDYDKNKAKVEELERQIELAQDDVRAYKSMLESRRNMAMYGTASPSSRNIRTTKKEPKKTPKQRESKEDKAKQTALEKINKEIDKLQKKYDNIRDKEGKGAAQAKKLTNEIISLEKQKLQFLIKGTNEYRKQLEQIRSYYSNQSKEYHEFTDMIRDNEIAELELKFEGYDLSRSSDRREAVSTLQEILSKAVEGSDVHKKYSNKFENLFPVEYNDYLISDLEEKRTRPGVDVSDINRQIEEVTKKRRQLNIQLGIEDAPQTDYEKAIDAYRRWQRDQQRAIDGVNFADFNAKISAESDRLTELVKKGEITKEQAEQMLTDFMENSSNQLGEVVVSVYTGPPLENIIKYWQDQMSDIEKQLNENDLDVEARLQLNTDWQEAQNKIDEITQGKITIKANVQPIYSEDFGSDFDKRTSYANAQQKMQALSDDYSIGLISYDKFKEELDKINEALENLDLKPINLEIKSPWMEEIDAAADVLDQFGSAIRQMGDVADDLVLKSAGTIAQAIANIWLGYSQATVQAAKLGPWAWAGFTVGALAQVIGVISAMKSSGAFAEGGIVRGQTTMGDKVFARLNAGEMVLNQRQQSNLFDMINSGVSGDNVMVASTVKVKGSDLYLTLKNYNKITGKKL